MAFVKSLRQLGDSMDTTSLILWAVAVVIGLLAAVFTAKSISKRKQIQKTGKNSTSIQSGRDTNISNDK